VDSSYWLIILSSPPARGQWSFEEHHCTPISFPVLIAVEKKTCRDVCAVVLCIVNNPACKDDNTKEIVGARAKDVHRGNPQGHKIENAPLNFLYTLGKVAFFFAKALIIILKN